MTRFNVQALLVSSLPNIRYFTGFTGSDGVLILTLTKVFLLVDGRYVTQAQEQSPECAIVCYKKKIASVQTTLQDCGITRLGFESERVTVATHTALVAALPTIDFIPLAAELDELRQCKDPEELALLAAAAELSSSALQQVVRDLRPGQTELEISLALEFAMKRAGAEACAFDFIVASGVRGALPHGRASNKKILAGELITIDFGSVCSGYYSDETVTVAVGTADAKQREIYQIVKEAHDLAITAVKPGVPLAELDAIARNHIADHGYAEYFGHGLGHGVGLEIHEKPAVNGTSEQKAAVGMVFTIEPGIYIPGWGGVRIEDTVVVTATGSSLLTKSTKEFNLVAV